MKPLVVICTLLLTANLLFGQQAESQSSHPEKETPGSLAILWTTGEKEVFTKVVYPYGLNSTKQGWWETVTLIVWGPSSKLLSEDSELQEMLKRLKDAGAVLTACKWCSDQYGVSEKLAELGVDVKYMGKPLTQFLKSGYKMLIF